MLRLAAEVRVRLARGSTLPSDDTVATLAAFKAPVTWNRYLPTLRGWERYAAGMNTPFLPADPGHFANFLADAAKKDAGSTQSKHRSCGIAALSAVAGVTSPTEDASGRHRRARPRRPAPAAEGRAPWQRPPHISTRSSRRPGFAAVGTWSRSPPPPLGAAAGPRSGHAPHERPERSFAPVR